MEYGAAVKYQAGDIAGYQQFASKLPVPQQERMDYLLQNVPGYADYLIASVRTDEIRQDDLEAMRAKYNSLILQQEPALLRGLFTRHPELINGKTHEAFSPILAVNNDAANIYDNVRKEFENQQAQQKTAAQHGDQSGGIPDVPQTSITIRKMD